jgi:glyoxylate carboligase
VFGELREVLPADSIVTLDTGAMCLQAADRLRHDRAPGLVTPLDFGLVGFGYAAALGAQAAAPDRPVVAVMGDGGFGMTMIEITTAVQHGLPVVAVVLDNGAWGGEGLSAGLLRRSLCRRRPGESALRPGGPPVRQGPVQKGLSAQPPSGSPRSEAT